MFKNYNTDIFFSIHVNYLFYLETLYEKIILCTRLPNTITFRTRSLVTSLVPLPQPCVDVCAVWVIYTGVVFSIANERRTYFVLAFTVYFLDFYY